MITARATATFLSFSFLSALPLEETEFQITHRWHNFHFSSPTAEARPPSAHPRTPTLKSEGGTGESRAAAARRISRRCAQAELWLVGERGPAAAPGSPSSAQHLARSSHGRCHCKLGPRTLGQELCSPERRDRTGRAREGASAQKPLRRRQEARQGGLRGPQNKELQAGRTCGFGCQVPNPQTRAGGAADGSGYRGWPD